MDNVESYVLQLKQCAQMLGYNEGQVLELFKITLPTRYYYLELGIENIREAVETPNKLWPPKIRQLTGKSKLHPIHVP